LATAHKRDSKKNDKHSLRTKKTETSTPERGRESIAREPQRPVKNSLVPQSEHEAKKNEKTEPQSVRGDASTTESPALTIYTIGHSVHPIDEFIALLKIYGIEQLVDVRTVPKSRHVPQFNSDDLEKSLGHQGIAYVHLKALGGLRHAKKDSINTGWRNASFRGYADYMSTDEFAQGIDRLLELAKTKRTVIMCAEAVPWRCHRSLLGDALLVRGVSVEDIMSTTSSRPHKLTPFAHVEGKSITYPADANLELFSA
jgi:hypothetical protein